MTILDLPIEEFAKHELTFSLIGLAFQHTVREIFVVYSQYLISNFHEPNTLFFVAVKLLERCEIHFLVSE